MGEMELEKMVEELEAENKELGYDTMWSKKRDPKRIDRIIDKIREFWKKNPDLRLGQIVSNSAFLMGRVEDANTIFYIEDNELEAGLNKLIDELGKDN